MSNKVTCSPRAGVGPGRAAAAGWLALLVCAVGLSLAGPGAAVDTLMVGQGGASWFTVMESASILQVSRDSLWRWPAEPQANLGPASKARGGGPAVLVVVQGKPLTVPLPRMARMVDGDPGTSWGPDDEPGLVRQTDFQLDLGGTFGVNRIRFYPRLDRAHRDNFLGSFDLSTSDGSGYRSAISFSTSFPNRQSVVDRVFDRRDVRYILVQAHELNPWEIAELEVYADGTMPTGEFVSLPLPVRGAYPVWGRLRSEGKSVETLPISVQTHTGPDDEPVYYYILRGDVMERVPRGSYLSFDPTYNPFAGLVADVKLGPILPNPAWSPWQTVTDGQVLSPGPDRYIQFRVVFPQAGTVVRQLAFEYVGEPLVRTLTAEINPLEAQPGQQTEFTLSMLVHLSQRLGDTGFRYLEVLTPAQVDRVERVRIDDQDAVFTARYEAGQGFLIDLWRRVIQDGSFVQLVFRAAVVRDGTAFQVRALDVRPADGSLESVYQMAREGDVDPFLVGGQLVVRLSGTTPVVGELEPANRVFTPNGDGVNDVFEVRYDLLKLIQPAPVRFEIFDLQGRRVRQGYAGADLSGQYLRIWDGCDEQGQRVVPGVYLYRVEVKADAGRTSRQGVVHVVY